MGPGFLDMMVVRKLSILILLLCVLFSLKNQNAETKKGYSSLLFSSPHLSSSNTRASSSHGNSRRLEPYDESLLKPLRLRYDHYRDSCPAAEAIIREVVRREYKARPDIAPALLRLVFHDCFIEGCDASVLLDSDEANESEKDAPPNETLKGFDVIDIIKAEVEDACPEIVSCADILALAAREAVVLAGGPFYPLLTGRRDSSVSFAEIAAYELPSPHDDLPSTIATFASRGFDEREAVALLGAHSVGIVHCQFFQNRIYNFQGTDGPDPSVDSEFLEQMKSVCGNTDNSSTSPPPSPSSQPRRSSSSQSSPLCCPPENKVASSLTKDSGLKMDYEGPGTSFGTLYYRSILQNKGILYADQQLTAGEETRNWVTAYASDASLFRQDFAVAMMKLSNLSVLTSPHGQVRYHCAKIAKMSLNTGK